MSGLLAAARYLTIVPLPCPARASLDDLGRAAAWFPVVGLGLGAALVVVDRVAGRLFPPLLAALLTLTAWKLLTGGLHLDGLADCLDALGGRTAEQRLGIMRDSRIGAFGAIGLILVLMLELVALADLEPARRWRVLLVAPALGRVTPPVLGRAFPAARADGQGARFRAGLGAAGAAGALAVGLAGAATLGVAGMAALAAALAAAYLGGGFMARRLGGLTGDVLGAAVEVAELVVLLTVSAWAHGGR